ncbi:unnamed protein product [Rotaria socialis]
MFLLYGHEQVDAIEQYNNIKPESSTKKKSARYNYQSSLLTYYSASLILATSCSQQSIPTRISYIRSFHIRF